MSVRYVLGGSVAIATAVLVACSGFSGDNRTSVADEAGAHDTGSTPTPDTGVATDGGPAAPAYATPLVDAGFFRIEATEVTTGQFFAFKFQSGTDAGAPWPRCPGKTSLGPGGCGARTTADNAPVTCVDWCDAQSYCAGIGRHLCGSIQGTDEWARACRGPNGTRYPYGPDPLPNACNTRESKRDMQVEGGTFPACVGGFPGLYDMEGNVGEWIDACSKQKDESWSCTVRGETFFTNAGSRDCNLNTGTSSTTQFQDVGFRCCAD